MANPASESPTHPDAPRAGGETPDIDLEATLRVLRIVEYDLRHRDEAPEPNATSNEIHAEFAETLAALRTALLARHRDGERWQPATSAPKTGEHVLVTCLNEGGFGFCGGKRQDWCAVVHYWDVAGEEGFYLSSGASSPFDDYALRFTHWRPLPVMCLCDYNLADAPSVLHQPPCPLSAPPAASEPDRGSEP